MRQQSSEKDIQVPAKILTVSSNRVSRVLSSCFLSSFTVTFQSLKNAGC
jgi:hypothetical protein